MGHIVVEVLPAAASAPGPVEFRTSDGRVRFHPNLYTNGKATAWAWQERESRGDKSSEAVVSRRVTFCDL